MRAIALFSLLTTVSSCASLESTTLESARAFQHNALAAAPADSYFSSLDQSASALDQSGQYLNTDDKSMQANDKHCPPFSIGNIITSPSPEHDNDYQETGADAASDKPSTDTFSASLPYLSKAHQRVDSRHIIPISFLGTPTNTASNECALGADLPSARDYFMSPAKKASPSRTPICSPYGESVNWMHIKETSTKKRGEETAFNALDSTLHALFRSFARNKTIPSLGTFDRQYLLSCTEHDFKQFIGRYKYLKIIDTDIHELTIAKIRSQDLEQDISVLIKEQKNHLPRLFATYTLAEFMYTSQQYFLAVNLMLIYVKNAYLRYYEGKRYNEHLVINHISNLEKHALETVLGFMQRIETSIISSAMDREKSSKLKAERSFVVTKINHLLRIIHSGDANLTDAKKKYDFARAILSLKTWH